MKLDVKGLTPLPAAGDSRVDGYSLSTGSLAFGELPVPPGTDIPPAAHELAAIVKRPLAALAAREAVHEKASADPTLSDVGRAKATEKESLAAAAELGAAQAELAEALKAHSAERDQLYAVPPIELGDVPTAIWDSEARSAIRSMPRSDQVALLARMESDPRLVAAILRGPMPIPPLSQEAERMWRDHVAATNPKAAAVAQRAELLTWAQQALAAIARHVPKQPLKEKIQ